MKVTSIMFKLVEFIRKKFNILLVFLIILSCNNVSQRTALFSDSSVKNNLITEVVIQNYGSFSDYFQLLPKVKLPITVSCNNDFGLQAVDYSNDIIKKYKPEGATILGLLDVTDKYVAFIYAYPADILLPYLETYDLNGQFISKLELFNMHLCATSFEEGISSSSSFNITTEHKLSIIDSVFYFDDGVKILKDSNIKHYHIDDLGEIK